MTGLHEPVPASPIRWVPTRAGILNVWRYDDETFEFHRGRLLLRGPNGSGKSMALELLLPFLLDGNIQASRLSSSAKSRGGLAERMTAGGESANKVGFLWVEFACSTRRSHDADVEVDVDADADLDAGSTRTFTIGVRLRASSSAGRLGRTWFTTDARVGHDLELLDASRTPLGVEELRAAVETDGRGTIYDRDEDYRRAVRERLFTGFSGDQYDSVILALLALRVEKVSHNLSIERLGEIMSGSLPPLDEHQIATIAEGFEKLDQRRDELQQMDSDIGHVRQLAQRQRRYAAHVLATHAGAVRSAETERDGATRRVKATAAALATVAAEIDGAERADRAAIEQLAATRARIETLFAAPAYQRGVDLSEQEQQLADARERRARAEVEVAERDGRARDASSAAQEAAGLADAAVAREHASRERVLEQAARIDGSDTVAMLLERAEPDGALAQVAGWLDARRQGVLAVRERLAEVAARELARAHRQELVEQQRSAVDEAEQRRRGAARALEAARSAMRRALLEWAGGSVELRAVALRDAVAEVVDPAAIRAAVAPIEQARRSELHDLLSAAQHELDELTAQQAAVEVELADVRSGADAPPPAPDGRRSRDGIAGAPFWQLVDFAPDVDDATRGCVESALAASGMLDAWVSPDGRVELPGASSDAVLDAHAARGVATAARASLADLLVAEPEGGVPGEIVERLLARIALVDDALAAAALDVDAVDAAATVGRDGSYRIGPIAGRGVNAPAAHVGATAREHARMRRMRDLERQLAVVSEQLEAASARRDDAIAARARLAAELAACPDGAAVAEAGSALVTADALHDRARGDLDRACEQQRLADAAAAAASTELRRCASEHALPASERGLLDVEQVLAAITRCTHDWHAAAQAAPLAVQRATDAAAACARAQADLDAARSRERSDGVRVAELDGKVRTLREAVGAEVAQLQAEIEAAKQCERALAADREVLQRQLQDLRERRGATTTAATVAEQERAACDERRQCAHELFVASLAAGFAIDADVEVDALADTRVSTVLEAARRVAAQLPAKAVDDANALTAVLAATGDAGRQLAGRVDVTFAPAADRPWSMLRLSIDGTSKTAAELLGQLSHERRRADEELHADEHALFERVLTGSLRRHVAGRIRHAVGLVRDINQALAGVRTSAGGVSVNLRWDIDSGHEQAESMRHVRRLLLRDPADLGSDDKAAMHAFFRSRIELVRVGDADASWSQQLEEVLDYRRWHRFDLRIRHASWDGFKDATARRMQMLSTGERSVVLHLPMLASLAAHYDSVQAAADAPAPPRLILLDELLAGVDPANRSQLLGMLETWDLDAVFTSDHEWCSYQSLRGIAIHHVHADDATGSSVTTSRFVWNGRERIPAPVGAGAP